VPVERRTSRPVSSLISLTFRLDLPRPSTRRSALDRTIRKKSNYKKNVDKAGIFENYTEFYVKRGTEEGGSFLNMANNGHKMVKTKFDWTGNDPNAAPKYTGVQAADKKPKKKGFFGK